MKRDSINNNNNSKVSNESLQRQQQQQQQNYNSICKLNISTKGKGNSWYVDNMQDLIRRQHLKAYKKETLIKKEEEEIIICTGES